MTFRLLTLAALLAAACGACSLGGDGSAHDADAAAYDGGEDAGLDPSGRIVLVSDPELVLPHDSSAEVKVLLLHGFAPVVGAEVRFTMHGHANDSSLSHLMMITDTSGGANVRVLSGLVEGTFSVRVGAEGFEPVYVPVTVSSSELASLTVGPAGEPSEHVTRHRAELYGGETCASTRVTERDFDRTAIVWEGSAQTEFRHLPVGADFAVLLEALDADGNTVALRCVDGVTIAAEGTTMEIALEGHDVRAEGDYDSTVRLELGEAANAWASRFEGSLEPYQIEVGEDAELLLDALEERLLLDGDTEGLDLLAASRDSLAEALAEALAGRGPLAAIRALAEALGELRALESRGTLSVTAGGELAYVETARLVEVVDGGTYVSPLGVVDVGGVFASPVRAELEMTTAVPPSLVASAYFAEVAETGDLSSWLADLGGCGELAAFSPLLALGTSCDQACLENLCVSLVSELHADALAALDAELASTDATVSGTLLFVDPDPTSRLAAGVVGTSLSVDLPGSTTSAIASLEGARDLP